MTVIELTRICPYTTIPAVADPATFLRRVGDRIRAARDEKGWSQYELATKASLNKETVNRMELGGNTSMESLVAVAAALGLNPSDLLRKSSDQVGDELEELSYDITTGYKRDDIPVIAEGDATPEPELLWDDDGLRPEVEDRISRPFDVKDPRAIAVRVRGDSMMPRYRAGDEVIVSPNSDVNDGDEVFIKLRTGERLLKVARRASGGWILESWNPAYPARFVKKSEIEVMQPIVWIRPARRGRGERTD